MMRWINRITTLLIIVGLAGALVFGMKYVDMVKGMLSGSSLSSSTAEESTNNE